jgi:hypothetical protein
VLENRNDTAGRGGRPIHRISLEVGSPEAA